MRETHQHLLGESEHIDANHQDSLHHILLHSWFISNDYGLKVQTVTAILKTRVDEYVEKVIKLLHQYFPSAVKIGTDILSTRTQRLFPVTSQTTRDLLTTD